MLDLSAIPTKLLRAELARRELVSPKVAPLKRQKWVCKCGNVAFGGGDLSTIFAESSRVWCRICIPNCRVNFYGENGTVASIPMQQHPVTENE